MMINTLFGVLTATVFVHSFKSKMYRYAWIPVLILVYVFASDPDQYIFFNLTDANMIGLAEKSILVFASVLLWMFARKESGGKKRWMPVLFCTTACVMRFVRSIAFEWYTGRMTESGADAMGIYQAFTVCCSIIDFVIKLAIMLMLVLILDKLSWAKMKTE